MEKQNSEPRISAVVPTYNRADLISRAVESILAQTRPPDEVIVVDDGSSDDTRDVVSRYREVRYLRQSNAGASTARNLGVENARYEWIAFLDSDDVWLPDHLEKMCAAIGATDGRAVFYFSDIQRTVTEGGERHWSRSGFHIDGPFQISENPLDWVLLPRQPTMLQASVIDREAYVSSGGLWPPLRVRHDNHLFIKLAARGDICAVGHVGTGMTDDDAAENRLFQTIRPGQENYETETVLMYSDLLRSLPRLPPQHRDVLRERLKGGYFSLARIALRDRRLRTGLTHALRGTGAFPASTLRSGARRLPVIWCRPDPT